MRSTKLTPTIAAAALLALLALAPATVSARPFSNRHPNGGHVGGCRVSLSVAERVVTAGETVLAYGRLSCSRSRASEAANQTVTLYQSSGGVPADSAVATTTTNALGAFQLSSGALTVNSRFYVVADGTPSPRRSVKVAAQVTLAGPTEGAQLATSLRTGRPNKVTFTGTVAPEDAGAVIVLQRQDALTGNEWHRIQFGRVGPGGSFSIVHAFVVPGAANIRVLVRAQPRNIASPSNMLTYEISQAQNPQLTINTAADPVPYGQSVAISGKLLAAPNTTVRLLARTVHQSPLAPVAQVQANASGEYAFPAQLPLFSTFYEVQGDGRTSAVLYEDVADMLTAALLPGTSIQSGQTLTFSGTVSPDHTGHVIYLERQNATGTAFHAVEVSTVTAGSVYTIAHTIYKVGTSVLRVRIPGDPQNGGAVSPPFTIQVAPASLPSTLTPEPPGNSSTPPVGEL